ncbi:MAG: hypothetical protein ACHQ1F_00735 [Spirochaetia bacterium]
MFPALLLLVSLASVPAESIMVSQDSRADLDGTIGVGWALTHGDLRVFCAWQGSATSAGRAGPAYPTLAASCAWLAYGPVTGEGLLREASNPLGFSAGSDVFAERTGVRLDGSLPAGPSGLLCMPLPGTLGFYCLPCQNRAQVRGCFASIQAVAGFRVEGFLSFSRLEPESLSEEWFLSTPEDPGGAMTSGGVRLGVDFYGLSLGATVAGSFPERAPSGSFQLLRGSWHENGIFAEALVGRIDAAYRRPDGRDFTAGSAFSGSAGLEGTVNSARVSYAVCVDQPGFAPRPFVQGSEVMGLKIEHCFAAGAGLDVTCRAEGEKRITRDCMGAREETSRWSGSLRGRTGSLDAAASVDLNEPGGLGVSFSGAFQETRRSPRLSLESRLEPPGRGGLITVLAGIQLEWKDARLSLESGMEGWSLHASAMEAFRHFRLRISWSTRCALRN